MRVGVVDIGTNSTRLLVGDVAGGDVRELVRESVVTRLGEGVERTGRLGEAAQERVYSVLERYAAVMRAHGCDVRTAVMTSAVRDAANGPAFESAVRDRFGLAGRIVSGEEEARLTYLGATAARDPADATPLVVIDIGGGSTEVVAGSWGAVTFHVSTQVGVVRHTERHITSDPPDPAELGAMAADVRAALDAAVPAGVRERTEAAVAVAGTATSAAAMDLGAWDPARVEGRVLPVDRLGTMLEALAAVPLARRRRTPGLHPDRAPTIVAGLVILLEALALFGLDAVEVSDRDILRGVAIDAAAG